MTVKPRYNFPGIQDEWGPSTDWGGHTLHERHLRKVNVWFGDGRVAGMSGAKLAEDYDIKYTTFANGELMKWFN